MTDWILLDSDALNAPSHKNVGEVSVSTQLSPHDVPIAIRGGAVGNKCGDKLFVIEFRYLDDEPWRLESRTDGIHVRVGKHSGRLYGIEIDPSIVQPGRFEFRHDVKKAVDSAIDELAGIRSRRRGRAAINNFRVAKAAIASVSESLFQPA